MTARAEMLRNMWWDDAAHASAIYCLPRPRITVDTASSATDKVRGVNYIHPATIDITPASGEAPLAERHWIIPTRSAPCLRLNLLLTP